MKKGNVLTILGLVLVLFFSLFACNKTDATLGSTGNNAGSGSSPTVAPDNNGSGTNDGVSSDTLITDWKKTGIFAAGAPAYTFDFSAKDANFTYETGNEENEALFANIASGEECYKDHFLWFSLHPDYIYRLNEACYKVAAEIIREGAFTQQLRNQYSGLFTSDATSPYFGALGVTNESYQIYFNDDWSIRYIRKAEQYNVRCGAFERWHYSLPGYTLGESDVVENGEAVQYDTFIDPCYNKQGLIGYKVTFTSLNLCVDMGDGKTADCSVDASYHSESVTEFVWNGQKQNHEEVTYRSLCRVAADFDNVYSGGNNKFDGILLYANQEGAWDLLQVWERYRQEALTPSLHVHDEKNEQKIYRLG